MLPEFEVHIFSTSHIFDGRVFLLDVLCYILNCSTDKFDITLLTLPLLQFKLNYFEYIMQR